MRLVLALSVGFSLLNPIYSGWASPATLARRYIGKRATERDWQQSVDYGTELLEMITAKTDAEATSLNGGQSLASRFAAVSDFAENGWERDPDYDEESFKFDLDELYDLLHLDDEEDRPIKHTNTLEVTVNGKMRVPVRGQFAPSTAFTAL